MRQTLARSGSALHLKMRSFPGFGKLRHDYWNLFGLTLIRDHGAQVRVHSQRIRFYAGEEFEGANRLAHGHAAAIGCWAAGGARSFEQRRLDWEVDDFRYPKI